MNFSLFPNYPPLEKGSTLESPPLNPLHPSMLCAKFGWNWPSGSGEEDFLISSTHFRYFVIISPSKRMGPFIWKNLNPLHPRMLCAKFGWNWSSGSWEEDENVKSLQTDGQTDRRTDNQTTDDRWSEKLTWAFSSGELKTKKERNKTEEKRMKLRRQMTTKSIDADQWKHSCNVHVFRWPKKDQQHKTKRHHSVKTERHHSVT